MVEYAAVAKRNQGEVKMASLTVRDIPDTAVSTLKRRASRNHRSLNGEVLAIISYVSSFPDSFSFPVQPAVAPEESDPILELAGAWEDSRPIGATIAEIEGARTRGREVVL